MSLSAAKIMAGDEIKGSVRMIREMVDQLDRLLIDVDEGARNNLKSLGNINEHMKRVKGDLESLKETAKTLRMLGLTTKVHSAKAGSDVDTFMALGQDISGLSEVISSKSSEILSRIWSLIDLVGKIHDNVRGLRERQRQQAALVVNGAVKVLDSLEKLISRSTNEAEKIAEWSRQISSNIEDVVMAIQYQDITSQALEAVRKEMDGIRDLSGGEEEEGEVHSTRRAMDRIVAARKSALQSSIVRESGTRLRDSISQVMGNLKDISGNVGEMAEVTSKISHESSLFLRELGKSVSSVTAYLSEVVESSREMSNIMRSLDGSVEEMSRFMEEIQGISSEIELIALNARIRAAQTQGEGAGMGVIAGSIQLTAKEANNYRESLLMKLENIARTADSLKERIEMATEGEEKELDHMVRELGMLLDALRYMQEKVVRILQKVDSYGRDLLESITDTIKGVSVHTLADRSVNSMTKELEKIASGILKGVPETYLTQIGGPHFPLQVTGLNISEQVRFLRELHLEGTEKDVDETVPEKEMSGGVEIF